MVVVAIVVFGSTLAVAGGLTLPREVPEPPLTPELPLEPEDPLAPEATELPETPELAM